MPTKLAPKREDNIDKQQRDKFDPSTRQQQAEALKNREDGGGRSQEDFDNEFGGITDQLKNDPNFNRNNTDNKEQRGDSNWNNAYTGAPKLSTKKTMNFKKLVRKYGPIGGVGVGLSSIMLTMMATTAPISLLNNFTESFVGNWDVQSISGEVRARRLLSMRLTGEATNGVCGRVALACKYSRPSNKMLNDLDKAGIKAVTADGTVIERQRLLNGDRPAFYETPEGTRVAPANFQAELQHNPEFRSAFRRAYNPRWINWSDDVAARYFGYFGLRKVNPDTIRNADTPDETRKAVHDLGRSEDPGSPDGRRSTFDNILDRESQTFGQKASRRLAKINDPLQLSLALTCVSMRVPGLYTNVARLYRFSKGVALAHYIYTAAHKIKSREGDQKEARNVATLMTETFIDPATGRPGKSAMDSGAVKYGLFGDVGSAKGSPGVQQSIPGAAGGAFARVASITESKTATKACDVATSAELGIALDAATTAARATPVGVAILAFEVVVYAAGVLGLLDDFYERVIMTGLNFLRENVDFEAMLDAAYGAYVEGVVAEKYGDIAATNGIIGMAVMANFGGNIVLSPRQAVAFNQRVQQPMLAQWAEEDRLNHSPFDISNSNTFLGSIALQFAPHLSKMSTVGGALSSLLNFSSASLSSMIGPPKANALLKSEDDAKSCDADYTVASSAAAAGPVCNVFYGVPVEHLGLNPLRVLDILFNLREIDAQGEIIPDSNLDHWKKDCHTGDMMSLDECMSNAALNGEGQAFAAVLYSLYLIDKRTIDGMDDENPGQIEASANAGVNVSTGAQLSGGLAWPLRRALFDANPTNWLDAHGTGSGSFTTGQYQGHASDIGVPAGEPIYAMIGGTVSRASLGGHGLEISSQVGGGTLKIAYAHGPRTNQNTTYQTGEQISSVACLGNCSGNHLHIDMSFNGQGLCPQDVFIAMRDNQPIDFAALVGRANVGCGRT